MLAFVCVFHCILLLNTTTHCMPTTATAPTHTSHTDTCPPSSPTPLSPPSAPHAAAGAAGGCRRHLLSTQQSKIPYPIPPPLPLPLTPRSSLPPPPPSLFPLSHVSLYIHDTINLLPPSPPPPSPPHPLPHPHPPYNHSFILNTPSLNSPQYSAQCTIY